MTGTDHDPFCQCGYRRSAHPTPTGHTPANFRRSVTFNMSVGDDDFEASARLFRDQSMDATKAKRGRR